MSYSESNGQELLTKLRDFLLIVANDGANRVFLERNARELIAQLDAILQPTGGVKQ